MALGRLRRQVCAIACACFLMPASALAQTLTGIVVGVTDGDTIRLLDREKRQYKVRLQGIDAPERGQPFGSRARESLSALVLNRTVQADCPKQDRYGRYVCKILVDETDVGLQQLRAGMGWWYVKYSNERCPTIARYTTDCARVLSRELERDSECTDGLRQNREAIPRDGG